MINIYGEREGDVLRPSTRGDRTQRMKLSTEDNIANDEGFLAVLRDEQDDAH